MDSAFDRCGLPYLALPGHGLRAALLPLTKLQLEAYLSAAPSGSDPTAAIATMPDYDTLCEGNPRASPRHFTDRDREGLFATNLLPSEAAAIAAWLIPGGRLPSVAEWRAIWHHWATQPCAPSGAAPAGPLLPGDDRPTLLLHRLHQQLAPETLLQASLLCDGLVEWAGDGTDWVGIGQPRPAFYADLRNPLTAIHRPLRADQRIPYFGARVVTDHG